MVGPPVQPEVVWTPDPRELLNSQMAQFRRWLADERELDVADYDGLWRWSVTEPEAFWAAVAEFFRVSFRDSGSAVLETRVMPGGAGFPARP